MAKRSASRKKREAFKEAERRIQQARETGATQLDLMAWDLASLPESLGQLTQLQDLSLDGNQLTTLPKSLGQLTQLKWLSLFDNRLTAWPEWLGQWTQLQELNLGDHHRTSLPESLGQLTQLQDLSLDDNQLTSLPEPLGQLTQLKWLSIEGNQLTTLPEWLRQLDGLTGLFLHGNEALDLPPEVLGPSFDEAVERDVQPAKPAEILEYYFRVRAGKRPLNEAKLILVGHGGVGKTSLVNRLLHGKFDKHEEKTEGIQITEWPLVLNKDERVRLNVWDFGGQEIMHSTHQFFLTQRSLYLLVLNGRGGHEDADAEYWLRLIESFGSDSPVIVVLNKIKEHPFDVNRGALRKKFPAVCVVIETDCDGRIGLDELRKAIERETDRLKHLRDAFPAAWFAIKDRLAGMEENYVSFERFREICSEHNEKGERGQESLAFHLNNLGIALNYKDDPRLRDMHVLNPRWVTGGIYAILNAKQLDRQKGVLRIEDLREILDGQKYPASMHVFLLDLMRKFELCFAFPEDDGQYLVAELLDKQQPDAAEEFESAECLNFRYDYPIVPEGLLPRFIVRTHVLSKGQPRWRTGAILEFEGNRALVKADLQDKQVTINVTGLEAGRRRLLAVIRSDFEHIHRSFEFKPEEMIPVPGHPDVVVPYKKLCVLESQGINKFVEVVDEEVVELEVQKLLNGVDLKGTRKPPKTAEAPDGALRLFYSYSHKDERLRDKLETHLKLLQRLGLIQSWYDQEISAGDEWKGEIHENLERADIILLLVSADFIASDYCYDLEMKRALERHDAGEARVIPVIVRDYAWHKAPFGKLQALPKDGKAVELWDNKDTAWRDVAEGIERAIEEIRGKRDPR